MQWIANARMYTVNEGAAAAWREFFTWLATASGVDIAIIDHAFPKPLADLWKRDDLGCVFMCGLPFVRSGGRVKPIAAPVPARSNPDEQPVYATHLIARAASFDRLVDTFGGRLGYTAEDSHSGYNALRHHLLPFRSLHGPVLYRESIGPFYTPRRIVEAVLQGSIDVGPVDSLAFDLIHRHEPEVASQLSILATTQAVPIPLLVASRQCPVDVMSDLQDALASFADDAGCADLRERLVIRRFKPVASDAYAIIDTWDLEARRAGYPHPG